MVDEDEAEPEGSADPDEGGASFRSRAAPAAGVLLLALITAVAAGAGTYIVNRESSTNDHADEAQATARVFLPEYVKARDGLTAMKKRGRAYVYHYVGERGRRWSDQSRRLSRLASCSACPRRTPPRFARHATASAAPPSATGECAR